jgi:hypothetical protein
MLYVILLALRLLIAFGNWISPLCLLVGSYDPPHEGMRYKILFHLIKFDSFFFFFNYLFNFVRESVLASNGFSFLSTVVAGISSLSSSASVITEPTNDWLKFDFLN